MLRIGFPIPMKENENRRAILPEHIPTTGVASYLVFETGYGNVMGIDDEEYHKVNAIVTERQEVCGCPIICNPKPVATTDEYFSKGKVLFGWIHAVQGRQITDALVENGMTAIAWEEMFERGRHCFWRNNEIAGEATILHSFLNLGRLPYQCRVAVIGRGNVARGAIRMLERLGCAITVYDKKTSPLLREEIDNFDVIVNAVLWDVFRKDHLIYEEDLAKMKRDAMIIDISCDEGMGVQSSHPTSIAKPIYMHKGVLHYAVENSPSLVYRSASRAISAAVFPFLSDLANETHNDVLDGATIVRYGKILDEKIRRFQNRV